VITEGQEFDTCPPSSTIPEFSDAPAPIWRPGRSRFSVLVRRLGGVRLACKDSAMETMPVLQWTLMNEIPTPDDVSALLVEGEERAPTFAVLTASSHGLS